MKPAAFAYAKARSLGHAIDLLGSHDGARPIAGGQSLIATLNMRLSAPPMLVDLAGIAELSGIALKSGHLVIGATTRHAEAERSALVATHAPLVAMAMPHIAHPAVRNRGTLGGSIAYADPAAELPACLVALAGDVEIAGPHGRRQVKADAFFKGLFETDLGPHDLLVSLRVPAATPEDRYGVAELARRHGDYAMVGLAAHARATGERLRETRLAYFGVGPTPVRARRAEAAIAEGVVDAARIDAAVAALVGDLDPADDVQATGREKKHLAGVLLRRVVRQLMEPRA